MMSARLLELEALTPAACWIARWLAESAPVVTGTAAGPIESGHPFHSIEEIAAQRFVRVRRDEFHTGRRLARAALKQLGCSALAIPIGEGRAPVWPNGYCGSISHTRNLCVAHVARMDGHLSGIGIDVEPVSQVPEDVLALISRPTERVGLSTHGALLLFMAKEAFFKAYFPVTLEFLDFGDVEVALDESMRSFDVTLVAKKRAALAGRRSFTGRFHIEDGYAVAAVWVLD